MFSMASSAHNVERSLDNLNNPTDLQNIVTTLDSTTLDLSTEDVQKSLQVLDSILTPILHFLEGTPVRAILLTAVVSTTVVLLSNAN